MAAVSAWGKPGAWALDAEEHEAELLQGADKPTPSADFPSLAAAAASKKKKPQRFSLAEFNSTSLPSKTLFASESLVLPTGPRERSAEELEHSSSRGFGYSSYGGGPRGGARDDANSSASRWGSARVSDEPRRSGFGGPSAGSDRDSGPSRADEVDDWGAAKKSIAPPPPERRDRGGGFFDSHSRADEPDSWISRRSTGTAPPSDGRRISGGGFDGPRERRGGFEMFNKEGFNGAGPDSATWGKKREEANGTGPDSDAWRKKREEASSGGRPRLVLLPRSVPLADGDIGDQSRGEQQQGSMGRSKVSNPFGVARPREEVLAEKGQDWKKIDERLESLKIREAPPEGPTFGKKGFRVANENGSLQEDRTDGNWRKENAAEAPPARAENIDEMSPEN